MNKNNKTKLRVNANKCILCGTCALAYDQYFSLTEEGTIDDSKAEVPEEEVDDVILICPVGAIEPANAGNDGTEADYDKTK